jgi:hypothetical protein
LGHRARLLRIADLESMGHRVSNQLAASSNHSVYRTFFCCWLPVASCLL